MTIPSEFKGRYFYHFTHIENLESIIKNGFLCTNEKESRDLRHTNIAYQSIQNRRSEMNVTCAPNGKVHDYVPFYFTTINPMLLSIVNKKNIDQPFLIFFAVSVEKILENIVVFTDASANTSKPPIFYNSPKDLCKLDWTAIDNTKWASKDNDERHKRMAEALVFKEVPLEWIDSIIVWDEELKEKTITIFRENGKEIPNVQVEPFNKRYFYFKKFLLNRNDETLVTGPCFLKNKFESAILRIEEYRKSHDCTKCRFNNIDDAITQMKSNFCVITELKGIYELETNNGEHRDNVSDHTKKVVLALERVRYYKELNDEDKKIVLLSAYLHDIGKGPKSKWENEIQLTYPDHPADGLEMLPRILSMEFKDISNYQIKKICLLVAYHDLIGDILIKERSRQELINLEIDENDLNMLIALTIADVSSINSLWKYKINLMLSTFVEDIKKEIS